MSVLPIVNPANNADGIALMPTITAIYPIALDEGGVSEANCFLVKKSTSSGTNKTTPVPVKITIEKLELNSDNISTAIDYGDDSLDKFRTRISIVPINQLDSHTEYSVILSKALSKGSVFPPKVGSHNIGTKVPLTKGPYTGLINDVYTIQILVGGNENTARFKVTRASDGAVLTDIVAKKRYIELEQGIFLKFDSGTYVAGDIFTFNVKSLVQLNDIYSWDFKTGDSLYVQPADINSSVLVGLPIAPNPATIPAPVPVFKIMSVKPGVNSVQNDPGQKAKVTIQEIDFNSKYRNTLLNGKRIRLIKDDTQPPSITIGITIDITFNTLTTKLDLVDFINTSEQLRASTVSTINSVAEDLVGKALTGGHYGGVVTFTFNKNIKTSSFDPDNLKILAESTAANYYGSIDYEYAILDNKLIITFL